MRTTRMEACKDKKRVKQIEKRKELEILKKIEKKYIRVFGELTMLRLVSSVKLPRCGFVPRYSPDLIRTPTSIIVCNNSANALEAYNWQTGALLGSEHTGLWPVDLVHEPRMAGNARVVCLAEKHVPYVVLKYVVGVKTVAVPLPPSAGEPVAVAVGPTHAAVMCSKHGRHVCVMVHLVTLDVTHYFVPSLKSPPDSMLFSGEGTRLLLAARKQIMIVQAERGKVVQFSGGFQAGHLGISMNATKDVYVTDMRAQTLCVVKHGGAERSTALKNLLHPTAVMCHEDLVHVLDYGRLNTYTHTQLK